MQSVKVVMVCLVGVAVLTAHADGFFSGSGWFRRRWPRPNATCVCNMTTPAGTTSYPQKVRINCTMSGPATVAACREACQAFLNKTQADINKNRQMGRFGGRFRLGCGGLWGCLGKKFCRDNINNSTLRADISYWVKSDVEGCSTPGAAMVGTAVINCTQPAYNSFRWHIG